MTAHCTPVAAQAELLLDLGHGDGHDGLIDEGHRDGEDHRRQDQVLRPAPGGLVLAIAILPAGRRWSSRRSGIGRSRVPADPDAAGTAICRRTYSLAMAPERFSGRTRPRHRRRHRASAGPRPSAWPPRGPTVVAVDVNAELLAKLAAEAEGLSGSVTTLVGDVGSEAGVEHAGRRIGRPAGPLDVVVNVAGVLSFSHTHEQSPGRVEPAAGHQPDRHLPGLPPGPPPPAGQPGQHRQPGLDRGPQGPAVGRGLRRLQGRRARLHPGAGRRVRRGRPPGQQHQPRSHRHARSPRPSTCPREPTSSSSTG